MTERSQSPQKFRCLIQNALPQRQPPTHPNPAKGAPTHRLRKSHGATEGTPETHPCATHSFHELAQLKLKALDSFKKGLLRETAQAKESWSPQSNPICCYKNSRVCKTLGETQVPSERKIPRLPTSERHIFIVYIRVSLPRARAHCGASQANRTQRASCFAWRAMGATVEICAFHNGYGSPFFPICTDAWYVAGLLFGFRCPQLKGW